MMKAELAFLILPLLIFGAFGSAQVSVSPLYEKLELSDRGQVQTTFSVLNGSSESIRFRATFSPFSFGESGIEIIESGEVVDGDLSPYLRAAPLEFEVPPTSEQIVRVIALVPPSAIDGELRAALVVEPLTDATTPTENTDQESVSGRVLYTYRFVAQIYVVKSDLQSELSMQEPTYTSEQELSLSYTNSGAISGIGSTTWELKRDDEIILASQAPERLIVLPKDSRNRVIAEDLILEPGNYTITGTFGLDDGGEPPVVLNPQPFTKTFTVK